MKISIQNKTTLPRRTNRYIKWKLYQLAKKFKHLHYAEVHLGGEGQSPIRYQVKVKLGIPGRDIIIRNQSENISQLLGMTVKAAHRYLNNTKYHVSMK